MKRSGTSNGSAHRATDQAMSDANTVQEWHGWQVGDVSLHVGMMPGRLNPCVYVHYGSIVEPLAYFRGHRANEQACRLLAILDRIVHARCAHADGKDASE